jgi:ABC-2 type transport system ATP-binding protein
MISVQGLSKSYGQTEAVRDLSFTVNKGEVVGFLGPNGAGKSTTMRILSGYLPADTGEVRIAGFDVFTQSVKARSRIGYLPENVPLYPEMRVGEYLSYRAALKGVRSRRVAEKVEDALQLCGLPHVRRQLIGTLSKGYRQRVGLADALVNEPDILILDEPTIGLDPEQIREVRALIKGLATRHTILLSSHILSEVEMTCSRVLILNQGRILAADRVEDLESRFSQDGRVVAEIEASPEAIREAFRDLPEVASIEIQAAAGDFQRVAFTPKSGEDLRPLVFEQVRQQE